MNTLMDYVNEVKRQRDELVQTLITLNVDASADETFNTLVPKVLLISGGSTSSTVLYDADTRQNTYLTYNSTIYSADEFEATHPGFCSSENGYVLNYTTDIFGWDAGIFTCSTTPINVTASTQIAMRFLSGSTETGVMRLVQSDIGTAEDILTKAQTEGSYIDLAMQWIYSVDYITTLTPCDGVAAGSYYLAWVGRSNNSRPKIQSITAIS